MRRAGTRSRRALKTRGNLGPALGVVGHLRQQDGDDCDAAASTRHTFRFGSCRIDSLIVTHTSTSPTPRYRLYTGPYDDLTLVWDSNDKYPAQALVVDVSFEYRIGVTVPEDQPLLMTILDDGVTVASAFVWVLMGENL